MMNMKGAIYGVLAAGLLALMPALGVAQSVKTLSVLPDHVVGGLSALGDVTLTKEAPSGGLSVALSASDPAVTVPSSVTVAAGKKSASFQITTTSVSQEVSATVTASANNTSASHSLTVVLAKLLAIGFDPSSVVGGSNSIGTVYLDGPAPSSSFAVKLSSNETSASVPTTVTFVAGKATATFTATTSVVTAKEKAVVTGTDPNGATSTGTLVVNVPVVIDVDALDLAPSSVKNGDSSEATVKLSGEAPSGGLTLTVSSDSTFATPPSSVVVSAGKRSASFTVKTGTVSSDSVATITVTDPNGKSVSAKLTVKAVAIKLVGVGFLAPQVAGGTSDAGAVLLNVPAGASGFVVNLSSDNSSVQVPASVTVAAGKQVAGFVATTSAVTANATANITAVDPNGVTVKTKLTVAPLVVARLDLHPDSVVGGTSSTATITLNGVAPTGGTVVTLTSSEAFAQVPATVTVAAGKSSVQFTVATTTVSAKSNAKITAAGPTGRSASAALTVKTS
jgi:hypothetical protein